MSRRERRPRRNPRAGPAPVAAAPVHNARSPAWRDPWAWASLLAIVPLLLKCVGAPLGEPVAEDFDFLHRTLFTGVGSLLDGGGSTTFWRPVAHQLYYATLAPLILGSPRVVAVLHALLLGASALLVYRALRPRMSGPAACVVATFPMLSESTRTLVSWPSQFVDVGLYCFTAIALHEATRRRLPTALAAALLALLCKEVAVVTLLLLPWLPGVLTRAERRRWLVACFALLALWAAAYLAVRTSAHLALPHGMEPGASGPGASWFARIGWALAGSVRAWGSLALRPGPADVWAMAMLAVVAAVVAFGAMAVPAARARLVARGPWLAWGVAWFALATASLAPMHPFWQPNRSHFGATGAGVVAALALEAVHPAAAGALVLGRFGLLALAPAPAATIAEEPPETGAFMDFAQLSRLQRFMAETRGALAREYPQAEPRANLVTMNLPRGLIYALGGDRAAQVWFRDSTVRNVNFARLAEDSTLAMIAGVQFQLNDAPQVVLLSPDAMRAQDLGYRHLRARNWELALESLARADALHPDTLHRVFHGNNAGYRAMAYYQLGQLDEAEREASFALARDDRDPNAGRVLGHTLMRQGRLQEAAALVMQLENRHRGEPWFEELSARIVEARAASPPR